MLARLGHYVQIVSGIVLIVGVVLVVVQLRQTETLTRAQLSADFWSMRINQAIAASGESPMSSYSKLCDLDELLTEEDVMVLHSLFLQRFFLILQARNVPMIAGFSGNDWKQQARGNFGIIVGTPQGREWWKAISRGIADQELMEVADEALREVPGDCLTTVSWIQAIKDTDKAIKSPREVP